jgi:hypothetical protein
VSHAAHHSLPGYHPDQILFTGCHACESRDVAEAIDQLDPELFARAWMRAAGHDLDGLGDISRAELHLLRVLAAVQRQLVRRGIPRGAVPEGVFVVLSSAETGARS